MALNAVTRRFYRFGEFQIDVKNRLLLRRTEIIPLTPKAFDLLLIFVENPGTLLEKEELMELGKSFCGRSKPRSECFVTEKSARRESQNP